MIVKSEYSSKTLNVVQPEDTPGGCLLEISYYNGTLAGTINVPTADLLAALDATANTDVKHRADAYEDATRAQDELKAAREHYMAELAAVSANRDENAKMLREVAARAEKAEAAIARVRDVRNEWSKTLGRSGHVVEIDGALADKPAFTLPTEAGSIIIASEIRMDHEPNMQGTLMLGRGGLWYGQTAPVSGGVLGIHERIHPDQIIAWKPARVVAEEES
ncbi:hypothetical protein AB0284_21530 [Pseudarthrobacter phenanthrenivorans]|uniref:hypothetical protein n=1 Tax=Pseudarthrobacter phenanthrenivorans TaxID=361575 RepID=UPI00344D642E